MKEKISVVIPVYNVEKYLSECLDSVVNQTYPNLQIILVDDGSTDSSGKICDEYAEKDSRITVIHQDNQGAGAAKNTGLELINGDYFSIIDSDDYIETNYYEMMISAMQNHKADVAQCLFRNVFMDSVYERRYNFQSKRDRVIKRNRFLFELLYDWKYSVFWNKLYKSSLLRNDIRFPVGRKIDDEFFTYKLICNAKKIININTPLYNYRMRKSSVMNVNNKDKLITDRIDCFIERLEYIKNIYPSLSKDYYYIFTDFLLYTYNSTSSTELKSTLEKYINVYPEKKENLFQRLVRKYKTRNLFADTRKNSSDLLYFD